MSRFHKLTVKDIRRETNACVSVSFEVPHALHENYRYLPGQYLTFKLKVDGQEIRRSYSICSCPYTDKELRVAVKEVNSGAGSTWINRKLTVGMELEVMEPMGTFTTPILVSNKRHFLLFAGGSGITPMMSILKSVLHHEKQSRVTLVYGNNDVDSIIFRNELSELEQKSNQRLKILNILNEAPSYTDDLLKGMMTEQKILSVLNQYYKKDEQTETFICGPVPMMQQTESALSSIGFPKDCIHLEYFTAPADDNSVNKVTGSAARLTIIIDGEEIHTELSPGESVLEAALRMNLDAPYACQGGSCCTCRALLTEGKVEMKVNYALLESEVKEGYILTCQSYAQTPELTVNYDKAN